MTRLTAKSSTIFIATNERTRVYHSMSDVPPHLRRRLELSTKGLNSATILIADRRGREELVRALQGQPTDLQSRVADSIRSGEKGGKSGHAVRFSVRSWLELLLPVAVGASLWLLMSSR